MASDDTTAVSDLREALTSTATASGGPQVVEVVIPINGTTLTAAVQAVQEAISALGIASIGGLQDALDAKATPADIAQAIALLTAGAPAQLDTFLETYNRFLADESALSALTGVVAGKQPLDATLTALAAISTAADRLIYATGTDQFALAVLTAFARQILAATDAASARQVLGLATVAATGRAVDLDVSTVPTSLPSSPGVLWSNGGVVQIS